MLTAATGNSLSLLSTQPWSTVLHMSQKRMLRQRPSRFPWSPSNCGGSPATLLQWRPGSLLALSWQRCLWLERSGLPGQDWRNQPSGEGWTLRHHLTDVRLGSTGCPGVSCCFCQGCRKHGWPFPESRLCSHPGTQDECRDPSSILLTVLALPSLHVLTQNHARICFQPHCGRSTTGAGCELSAPVLGVIKGQSPPPLAAQGVVAVGSR